VGILAALRHRDRTGEGQLVDVAQLDCMIAQTGIPISNYLVEGKLAWEIWRDRPTVAIMFGFFRASDGYVYVAAEGGQVDRLKELTGSDLESNEDLQRWVTGKEVRGVVDALVGVNVPVAPIYQLDEVVEDPQVKARGMIVELEHPRAGKVRQPNFPIRFSRTPAAAGAAPTLGQHNEEILSDLLGYGVEEIKALRKKGIIT
jgi:CoA:oxalate CoA-transferase